MPRIRSTPRSESDRSLASATAAESAAFESQEILRCQNRVLEMIARGAPLHETLDVLVRAIEDLFPEMLGSILLLDPDGVHLRHGAAPSLPDAYVRAIDGESIGPKAGSCGTAAYRRAAVIVEDLAVDPLWEDYRAAALPHGLRACWSTPIFDRHGRVLGTFALYFRTPRVPTTRHLHLIDATTSTAAIAIAQHREIEEARQREIQLAQTHDRLHAELAERVKAEQERAHLADQLQQAQKIDSLGRLAGGVAHDFNNLLTVIIGFADLLLLDVREDDPLRAGLVDIRDAAERAASLTRQLLAFSRKQLLQPRILDLNALLRESAKMLTRLLGEDIALETVLDPALARVSADPGQIDQVIVNLAINARDAMPQGGKLTIETRNVVIGEDDAQRHASFQPGAYVLTAISDNGQGIDPRILPRIFEPFFTTKEQGRGTGLGLSTVYGIVKQSGGWIWVYSEPKHGTTFKIYLPQVEAAEAGEEKHFEIEGSRDHETVLVVEDEESVRKLTCEALRRYGYHVIEAANGGEALLACEQRAHGIPMLITDVVMPQMSGPELATRLRQLHPEMRVLYTSGYTDDAVVRHGLLDNTMSFLQKPFSPSSLVRKVREVLDQRPP